MILGVDTGTATCGWARFDPAKRRFAGLGAIKLERDKRVGKTDDNADRVATVADELLAAMDGCNCVIAERMSFPPGGQVPIALGFGSVVGIARAAAARPSLYTVKPQDWQRAVLPGSGKKVNYSELERVVGEFVRRDPASAIALDSIPKAQRNHALDACAIALMGAFRLGECRLVRDRGEVVVKVATPPPALELAQQQQQQLAPRVFDSPLEISDRTLVPVLTRRLRRTKLVQLFLLDMGDGVYASAKAQAPNGSIVECKASAEDLERTLSLLLNDLDIATTPHLEDEA